MAKNQTPAVVAATVNIERATKLLTDAYRDLESLVVTVEDLDSKILSKNQEIIDLNIEFSNRLKQEELDLKLAVKENLKAVADQYLSANNLEALDSKELARLKTAEKVILQQAEKDKEAALTELTNRLTSNFSAKEQIMNAEHAAKLAEATANNNSLQDKVDFLSQQVQDLLIQLSEQRQAEIEKVKAANPQQHITNVTEVAKK